MISVFKLKPTEFMWTQTNKDTVAHTIMDSFTQFTLENRGLISMLTFKNISIVKAGNFLV